MSLADLTPVVDALVRPWTRRLAERGYTAGMITLAGTAACLCIASLVVVVGARWYAVLLLVPALVLRLVTLRVQALLVQEHGKGSLAGRLLDEFCRPVSEVGLFWPLAWVEGIDGHLVVLCCLLVLLTEFAGLAVTAIGAERRREGPMDDPTRTVALAGVCLLLGVGVRPGWWTWLWFQVLPFLQAWTIACRLREGLRQVDPGEPAAPGGTGVTGAGVGDGGASAPPGGLDRSDRSAQPEA